ncbi:hypothetical protein LSH36_79g11011 [Paralvinella palmiformis]|uniref:C2H2-type domain-containing protein n=1 Tax=Paralvinella palmiformis TaxID=53620 RepID=A0AAD9K3Y6_9ANNE|nr:hypothetical protein LSH36_79g11011 [Paralvinella palmiformis]
MGSLYDPCLLLHVTLLFLARVFFFLLQTPSAGTPSTMLQYPLAIRRRTRSSAVSPGDKQYRCDICNETFSQGHCVRRHKLSVHERVRYFCSFCNKSYCQKGHLAIHIKSQHGTSVNPRMAS